MKLYIIPALLLFALSTDAQEDYNSSMEKHRASYVEKHQLIEKKDKKKFSFFPVSVELKKNARFEKIDEAPWFNMETSAGEKQPYRVYGIVHFKHNDTTLKLRVYQSKRLMDMEEHKNHLFIPFTDLTNGEETYENGRYLDFNTSDFNSASCVIDFNKAYNPYCAYVSDKFSCPIPPRENHLAVAIKAGEKKFH